MFTKLNDFFKAKHGIELQQVQKKDLTEIVLVNCKDVKIKKALMKLLQEFCYLNAPDDWSRVFHQIDA